MGTALCIPPSEKRHNVERIETHLDTDIIEALHQSRRHPRLPAAALGACLPADIPVVFLTRGHLANNGDLSTLPDHLQRSLPPPLKESIPVAAIVGPSIAREVNLSMPTTVVLVGSDRGWI
jgi:hypothetical protein